VFSNYRFLFETQNMNDQKQIRQLLKILFRSVCSGKMNREKEKKQDTSKLYRFLPQTGSSPVPLALPRRVH